MKILVTTIIFSLLFFPLIASSAWRDMDGNTLPDNAWMKSSGDFGAQLLLIENEKEFFRIWQTPSKVVNFKTTDKAYVGRPIITPIIFSGCVTSKEGMCNVIVDFEVLRPNGTSYAKQSNIEVWTNKPAPKVSLLELSIGYLKIIIEPEDPNGTYTVNAKVTDAIKEVSFTLTQHFSVDLDTPNETTKKSENTQKSKDIENLSKWFTYYYRNKATSGDENNIQKMFSSGFFKKPSAVAPLIIFISGVLQKNKANLLGWEPTLSQIREKHNKHIVQALWESNSNSGNDILDKWYPENMDVIKKIRSTPPVDLKVMKITSPAILDMLWAKFMVSGDTAYVQRIIDVLSYPVDSNNKDERINNMLLVGAAKWSLTSNSVQHELVYNACKNNSDNSDKKIAEHISEIIQQAETEIAQQGAPVDR